MALKLDELRTPRIDFGKGIELSFDLEEYTDEPAKQKAAKELRETPEIVLASIKELRELICAEKELLVPIDKDAFLKRFLRPKKYYADSTFEMMKAYYKLKQKEDSILSGLSTELLADVFTDRLVQILPKRDQHGRRIMYMEMGGKWNCSKISSVKLIRATNMLMEAIGREPRTQLHGVVFIVNFDNLSFSHIGQFSPKFVKTIVDYGQRNSPYRVKGIHIVNNARMFNFLFKVFKPFLGKKWSQRIFLHAADKQSLHQHIDPASLPSFLGGNYELPEYDGSVVGQLLDCYKDKSEESSKYGYTVQEK
ncbi:cellular retinaldehyde-binding protein [Anopheles darlingi]|uniref:Cellular retinaldehyde-binding protein n=1 Tax=Anopheles darlingi TaxID=43151 RepID=W5JI15_ANODA|nr:cellular retinaldehyde-binding protein [Anopheles darlingi]